MDFISGFLNTLIEMIMMPFTMLFGVDDKKKK